MNDETQRINELKRYGILDTPEDGSFSDLCEIAASLFHTPVALVTLVDTDRVWFLASHGVGDTRQIDRGPGLCTTAILQDDAYIAPDLRQDPNSLANPLVAQENGFRFYAAVPIRSSKGYNLGTMCVLDYQPRQFSDADSRMLGRFSRIVMQLMEHRLESREIAYLAQKVEASRTKLAYQANHDSLTKLLNRSAMENHLAQTASGTDTSVTMAYILLDVDHFKTINDTYGHQVGDSVLSQIGQRLKKAARRQDKVARIGGEEFALSLSDVTVEQAVRTAERVCDAVRSVPIAIGERSLAVTLSGGICIAPSDISYEKIYKLADSALYHAKNSGRDQIAYCTIENRGNASSESSPRIIDHPENDKTDNRKALPASERTMTSPDCLQQAEH